MSITINPGSGPVPGATYENSVTNTGAFIVDLREREVNVTHHERKPDLDSEGRYGYRLFIGQRPVEIEMPGLPLDQVRFTAAEGQSPWDFPRLYVDGGSWLWSFALNAVTHNEIDEEIAEIADQISGPDAPVPALTLGDRIRLAAVAPDVPSVTRSVLELLATDADTLTRVAEGIATPESADTIEDVRVDRDPVAVEVPGRIDWSRAPEGQCCHERSEPPAEPSPMCCGNGCACPGRSE